jgi:hypothetical protein
MIAKAAGQFPSGQHAARAVQLAGVEITPRHLQRIASEIGTEMARQRDKKAANGRRKLPVRVAAPPAVVAVEVDGGRLRTRASDQGPGVHDKRNQEDKVACLVNLQSEVHAEDPQPEPPESFPEPRRVQRLVRQTQGQSGDKPQDEPEKEDASEARPARGKEKETAKAGLRTCVASMVNSEEFGRLVAAEAQERGFYSAERKAFVGDGAAYNWSIQKKHFGDFVAVADFLHVLCYVYLAAWAVGKDEAQRWSTYVDWLRSCWLGRVEEVIEELRVWQGKLGKPPGGEEVDSKDPRVLVAEGLRYLENNKDRMDYAEYRRQGLPITSSLAESLVGEVNARVKSRGKFWNRPEGAEAILQLRAAELSEDERLERYFRHRPGCPYRRREAA